MSNPEVMRETVDVSEQCTFSSAIDITTLLDDLGIQCLDVHERRAIVIFAGAILNLECREGELTALEQAKITVSDLPVNTDSEPGDESDTATALIEDFVDQLLSISHST